MWTKVDVKEYQDGRERTEATRVPGGWLVRQTTSVKSSLAVSIAFLPDPKHSWDIRPNGIGK